MADQSTKDVNTDHITHDGKPAMDPEAEKSLFDAFDAVERGEEPTVRKSEDKKPEASVGETKDNSLEEDERSLFEEEKQSLDSVFNDEIEEDEGVKDFLKDLSPNNEEEEPVVEDSEPEEEEETVEESKEEDSEEEDQENDSDDDEELDEVLNNPHTKEKTRKRIQKLLKEKAELKTEIDELNAKLSETSTEDPEEVQRLQEELTSTREQLSVYMRRYDLENDPQLKEKYDSKLDVASSTIMDILKRNGLPEKSELKERENEDGEIEQYKTIGLDSIEESGGFIQYAVKNPQVYRTILDSLDPLDADVLRSKVAEYRSLEQAKKLEIDKLSKETEGYFEKQQEAYNQQLQEFNQVKEATKETAVKQFPWLQTLEPQPGSTPEQVQQIQEHNKKAKSYLAKLDFALNPQSTKDTMDVALAAVYAYNLADELRASQAQVKQLEERISKIKRSAPRVKASAPAKSSPKPAQQQVPMGFDAAVEAVASGSL